ncbi:MAG TPA: hypothetical protein DHW42_00540 [Candidatus Marinimicrobia bacterium]|nr:hypothetical protein [Candidatus Neomarinimicrobiota bacterium]
MEKIFRKNSIILVLGILLFGAMVGSLAGELLKLGIPDGVVKEVFLRSKDFVMAPGTIDFIMFSITLGFTLKLNLIGILGILVAYYLLRFWR